MNEVEQVKAKLQSFLLEKFPLARTRRIGANDSLLESGIVDSLGVLDLVGFAESEFSIQVSDDELLPENFQTIDDLAAFVMAKRGIGVVQKH